MADDNLSDTETVNEAKSFDQSVEDLSKVLGDPEKDPAEKPEDDAETEEPEETSDDADSEDAAADDDEEDEDGSEPVKGGRFAPDTAKVTLEDGTVTTVAELKRNNLYQRDYTRKTQEVATERKQVEEERAQVGQYAQSLNQARDYLAWFAESYMPPKPTPFTGNPMEDPAGFMQYQQRKEQWEQLDQAYRQFEAQRQMEEQRKQGETQKQMQQRLQTEAAKLREAFPVLNDPEKGKTFWEGTVRDAQKYFGISKDEVQSISDHRMVKVLRVAIERERAREKAPKVQEEVKKAPPMRGGKRAPADTGQRRERQVLTERLLKTGDLATGAALLERLL